MDMTQQMIEEEAANANPCKSCNHAIHTIEDDGDRSWELLVGCTFKGSCARVLPDEILHPTSEVEFSLDPNDWIELDDEPPF